MGCSASFSRPAAIVSSLPTTASSTTATLSPTTGSGHWTIQTTDGDQKQRAAAIYDLLPNQLACCAAPHDRLSRPKWRAIGVCDHPQLSTDVRRAHMLEQVDQMIQFADKPILIYPLEAGRLDTVLILCGIFLIERPDSVYGDARRNVCVWMQTVLDSHRGKKHGVGANLDTQLAEWLLTSWRMGTPAASPPSQRTEVKSRILFDPTRLSPLSTSHRHRHAPKQLPMLQYDSGGEYEYYDDDEKAKSDG